MCNQTISQAQELCINWDIEGDVYIKAVKKHNEWEILELYSDVAPKHERMLAFITTQLKRDKDKWIAELEKNKVDENEFVYKENYCGTHKFDKFTGMIL